MTRRSQVTAGVSLDRKLAAATTKISGGELGRELTQASSAALSVGRAARGRVLLAIVFRYYAAGHTAHMMFYTRHLRHIVVTGESLESFQPSWAMALSELGKAPDPDVIQHLYYRQVQRFKPLAEDMSQYRRAKRQQGLRRGSLGRVPLGCAEQIPPCPQSGPNRVNRQGRPSHRSERDRKRGSNRHESRKRSLIRRP